MTFITRYAPSTSLASACLTALLSACLWSGSFAQAAPQEHDHDHDHDEPTAHTEHKHDDHEPYAEHDDHGGHDHAKEEHTDEHEHDHTEHEAGVVSVPAAILHEFDIQVSTARAGVLHESVVLPGEIQFNREHLAYVTPRYAGTVSNIKARLADQVTEGQVLAELESTESLRPFPVKAPFDGTVVAYDITPGETVEAGKALFTVANLNTVWADLRIYQRDIQQVRPGQQVVIENGHEGPQFKGTISYIAPAIDEHTRTGLARVVVDNTAGAWRPGQFVKGRVSIDEHAASVVIPRSAILSHEGETVVFVQTDAGFEARPVRLGHSDDASIEVLSGLEPGEAYVSRNAISLKAELNKGSFGGHAGHVH